jgi:hypothetical protein
VVLVLPRRRLILCDHYFPSINLTSAPRYSIEIYLIFIKSSGMAARDKRERDKRHGAATGRRPAASGGCARTAGALVAPMTPKTLRHEDVLVL